MQIQTPESENHIDVQRAFAWGGIACCLCLFVGLWPIAGFIPPPDPSAGQDEIVRLYADNATAIRIGLTLAALGVAFCGPWAFVIALQMKRIEGRHTPLTYVQLGFGALFVLEFLIPVFIWQAAAFRPEAVPEFTWRMNDYGWLMFIAPVSTGVLQTLVIGAAILRDKRTDPIFPRWIGYASIWCGVLFMPGCLIVFFKDGPFAWNGLISWWLLLAGFGIWVLVLSYGLLKHAIPHQARSEDQRSESVGEGFR